jgi:hypothetical protein
LMLMKTEEIQLTYQREVIHFYNGKPVASLYK